MALAAWWRWLPATLPAPLGGGTSQLLHQAEHVHLNPVLASLAILQPPDIAVAAANGATRRRHAHEFAAVGTREVAASRYPVAGHNLILDCDAEIREGGSEYAIDIRKSFDTPHWCWEVVVDILRMDQIGVEIGSPDIHALFEDPPDDASCGMGCHDAAPYHYCCYRTISG
jgi:hypothetical protein